MFAEPEVREFIQKAETLARTTLIRMGQQDEGAAMASRIAPPLVKTLLTRPAMVYLSDLQMTQQGPAIKAGVVINLGPNFNEINRLLQLIPAEATQNVTIGGAEFRKLQPPGPGAPAITFGTRGPYLIVAVGDGEAEALMERAQADAPAWVGELRERFDVDRVATVTRLNVAPLIKQFAPMGGPQAARILELTGLGNVTDYVGVTGLDEKGFVQFAAVDFDGEPKGLLALAPSEPLTVDDLAPMPLGSLIATAFKTDLGAMYDGVMEMVGKMDPNAVSEVNEGLLQVEQVLGMRVREDILASFGDVWTLHTHEEDGGLVAGWTLTVSVENASRLGQLSQRLMQLAAQSRGGRDPKVEWSQFDGQNIYMLSVPDAEMPFAPAWCVTKDRLVVGLYPQAIKSYLIRQKESGGKTVASDPKVAAMMKTSVTAMTAVDNKRFAELLYPLAQLGLRMAVGEAMREEFPIDYAMLPSLTSISRHLGTGVTVSRRTENGFEMEQHQALPGGNVGATAPISIALLLPAVQSARGAARRVESSNNLKQIALAFHNYTDTYRSFPPRYSTDKDGKPLLSWRVYLLPFIEQNQLFEQFKLDEPWDSEHNKKLIAQMPRVYATPKVPLPPGKTTYLAIASDDAVMQGPKGDEQGKTHPRTTSFRDVLDGTSNTIMAVEAGPQSAVTWTKPDDYEYPENDPARGLKGVYPNVFLAAFTDGSVQNIDLNIGAAMIKALFTRAGGEVVNIR